MCEVLILFVLILTLAVIGYFYVQNAFLHWQRSGIPYLEPKFPFGNFRQLFLQKLTATESITELYNQSKEAVVGVLIALHPVLILRDPTLIQNVMTRDFSNFNHRGAYSNEDIDPLMNNLLMQDDKKWKLNRIRMNPAFTSIKLKGMFNNILDCGSSLHKYIDRFAKSGETVEIHDMFARYMTNVIASIAFGINIDCIENPKEEFKVYGSRLFEPTLTNMLRLNLAFIYPKLAEKMRMRIIDKDVSDFMIETVRQNFEFREKNNVVRKDFFQLLMQLQNTGRVSEDDDWSAEVIDKEEKGMSFEEMAAQAYAFFVGGYDPSTATMSFCAYELAKNLDIQSKVRNEINQVLEKHDGKLTYESIHDMKYLDSCIDETLRMYTPCGFLVRKCTKDYYCKSIVIRAKTNVLIPIAALHTDSKYYSEPHKFMPERFDEEAKANRSFIDAPFFAFGGGPRICLGLRLAKLQVKVGLVLLFSKFEVGLGAQHINKELKINPISVSRRTIGGINLHVKSVDS